MNNQKGWPPKLVEKMKHVTYRNVLCPIGHRLQLSVLVRMPETPEEWEEACHRCTADWERRETSRQGRPIH